MNTRQNNDLQQYINDLIDAVSFDIFTYINMGLFQTDRLTFLLLMTIQVQRYLILLLTRMHIDENY